MGAYCLRALIPHHTAKVDETLQVLWSDYHGAVLFGDDREVACIPHKGCRLEIVAAAGTPDRKVDQLLPGQVIRYKGAFLFLDRFELPGGTTVGLRHLVGFKMRLAAAMPHALPDEDIIVQRTAPTAAAANGPALAPWSVSGFDTESRSTGLWHEQA